jgi:hypothetical protein
VAGIGNRNFDVEAVRDHICLNRSRKKDGKKPERWCALSLSTASQREELYMTKSRIFGAAALLLSSALVIPAAMAQSDTNSDTSSGKTTSTKNMQHQSNARSTVKGAKVASSRMKQDRRHQARYGRSSERYASNSWDNTVDADYNLGGPSARGMDNDVAYNDNWNNNGNWNNRSDSNWNNTVEADYNLGGPSARRVNRNVSYNNRTSSSTWTNTVDADYNLGGPSGNRYNSNAAYNGDGYNNGWNRQDNGFWPANTAANVVGGAVDTAGAVAIGAVDTADAIATAPFRNNGYASYDNNGWNNNGWNTAGWNGSNNIGSHPGYDSNAAWYGNRNADYDHVNYAGTFAQRNDFVCQPGTYFRGEDGHRHICQ